ncbi:ankyrin repeat-containing protein [European chub iridovirus]|nr:ankyrin repeat-containing protein [European chub iridovirus]
MKNIGMDVLFEAIESNDLTTFATLIETYPELIDGLHWQNNITPLGVCVEENKSDFVRVLLRAGADPNKAWEDSIPLIEAAAFVDRIDVLYDLLDAPNINVNVFDNNGYSALFVACGRSNVPGLDALLRHPDIEINLKEPNTGTTAIYKSIHDYDVFEMMYSKGANINVIDKFGVKPLDNLFYYYTQNEQQKMSAIAILERIARDSREYIYFSSAAFCNMLRSEHIEPSVFDKIFEYCDEVEFTEPEVTSLKPNGYTPLQLAVYLGLIDQTNKLIEKTETRDINYLTPFIFNFNNPASSMFMFMYLLANKNLDVSKYTALSLALQNRCYDCAHYMLTYNIGLNVAGRDNKSEMAYLALFSSNLYLVTLGVDKNMFRFQDVMPSGDISPIELYLNQPPQIFNLEFLDNVIDYVSSHQGYFHLRNIPEWFTRTDAYATYKKYNTLRHRSLSYITDHESKEVKAFKRFRNVE